MGVPKFFRYISERYPCLSQLILESDIPEFDNLYLDMNGIIHNCSHPNDYDPHFRITEEKIIKDIFHYIEVLFRIIRPQKLFFMAIDGVAPRAKMNQQRGRRFRSAKEAQDREKEVLRRGEKLPDADRFDSNCITPGTSFMARLQAQLKYFVSLKISTDKMWQNVKIILSGHECPGEGEHKIMDYIRYIRAQPDHDPNTRHCLYGLDADLIMLGLCSHEPHFALLREEVKFGRKNQSKKTQNPEDTKFFLLHLSLMREYLEMEFSDLKTTLPFEFNVESIIDDWVLMGFLVGNDFIPHLPELHISSGALSILFKAYMEVLPTLDGYLNESGTLNLARFEAYMRKLGSFDIKQFREKYDDLRYLEKKSAKSGEPRIKLTENDIGFRRNLQPFFETNEEKTDEVENEPLERYDDQAIQYMMDMEEDEGSDYYDEDEREKDRLAFFQEFYLHKRNYYQEKLEYEQITPQVLRGQAEGYILALQWNLNYYYNGICSWSWYYPHHYAPYISDIQNFKNMKIEFNLGKPFQPFEQLLAVLPSLSKNLLPEPFQELMVDVRSPIFDFYPLDFQTDLNGKKNDWEAVVLIPFIDEKKLLKAMESCYDRLTDEEKERNKHGPMHVYTYSEEILGRYEAPAYFNPIEKNHALDVPLYREDIAVPREQLQKGLLPGVLLDVFFPGFPTFKHIRYTSSLEGQGVKIFQSPSQGLNMIVKPICMSDTPPPFETLMSDFMNKIVHVHWPYLAEANVVGISSKEEKCSLEAGVIKREPLSEEHKKTFEKGTAVLKQEFLKSRGIDVGEAIDIIIHVRINEGQKFTFSGGNKINLEKKWGNKLHSFPMQIVVKELRTKTSDPSSYTLDDIFPVGCHCFVLNKSFYGCLGLVSAKSEDWHVNIKLTVPPEPKPNELRIKPTNIRYYNNAEAAYRAKIPNYLLARITGTILILDCEEILEADKCQKVNIGLNLKFSRRNQQLPGYTKRNENSQWLYSDKTIALVQEYADAFPEVMRYLTNNSDKDNIFKKDLFPLPGQSHMLNVITNWLNSKAELKAERRSCDAELLESDVIANLEFQIESFMRANKRGRYVNLKSKPNCLYQPSSQVEKDYPDTAEFHLLDRVVNVRDNFVVPLGNRGTIIGIEKQPEHGLTYCDILFDSSFSSGMQYHTKKKRVYKLPDKCLLNITYTKKKFEKEEMKKMQPKIPQIYQNSGPPNHQFLPPPLMSQKIEIPMRGSPLCSGPPGSMMIVRGGQNIMPNMSYSNGVADRPKIPPKVTQYRIENNIDERIRKSVKAGSPAKVPTQIVENRNGAGGEEEKETTMALKKMLRISDDNHSSPPKGVEKKETERRTEEKNDNKGYVIELQELFQKAGKGNPRYEYYHTDGNFRATLHLPGIDIGISSDPAPTKQQAGEKAAFLVLQFLNLVKNYGDKVPPLPTNENALLDLNLQFLRLQSQLQDMQRQQNVKDRPPAKMQYAQPEVDGIQSLLRTQAAQQQKLQMIFAHQQAAPQLPHQQALTPYSQTYPSGMPFQPPHVAQQRQMTMATNYIYQQNVPAKYPVHPQQLYYQNVQNIYYNQPIRPGFQIPTPVPQQQWFQPMVGPNLMNMPPNPNVQPRTFYAEQLPQNYNQQSNEPVLNYLPSSSQTHFPTISNSNDNAKISANSPQPMKSVSSPCSGRISKTPKKKRLAANFATKAAT